MFHDFWEGPERVAVSRLKNFSLREIQNTFAPTARTKAKNEPIFSMMLNVQNAKSMINCNSPCLPAPRCKYVQPIQDIRQYGNQMADMAWTMV